MMRFFRGKLKALLPILVLLLETNCTPKQIASDITSQIFKGGAPSFEMESDVQVAESTGLSVLKMMEAFQYDNPKNKNYLTLLSRSYANYTFGFLEWNMMKYKDVNEPERLVNEERAKTFYMKGKNFGIQLLNRNASFEKALNGNQDDFTKSLKGFGRADIPGLFWTAMNWGSWINLNKDSPLAISEFPKVEALMYWVLELDENYFYGGPHLFFGVSFGSRPTMFGGNPAKSKEHFERAAAAYQRKFLMVLVMQAQTYAVQSQDRALFDSLLNEVLNARAEALPEQRLANEIAKLRARWLLDHGNTMF